MLAYEIIPVANGWMVQPRAARDTCIDISQIRVFNDFEKMCEWIRKNIKPSEANAE